MAPEWSGILEDMADFLNEMRYLASSMKSLGWELKESALQIKGLVGGMSELSNRREEAQSQLKLYPINQKTSRQR